MGVNEITSLKCDCGCGKTFTGNASKSNMKKHKERMKLGNGFTCKACEKVFENLATPLASQSLAARMKSHLEYCPKLNPQKIKYSCHGKSCKESFSNKRSLNSHVSKCPFLDHVCKLCRGIFANKMSLSKHFCPNNITTSLA